MLSAYFVKFDCFSTILILTAVSTSIESEHLGNDIIGYNKNTKIFYNTKSDFLSLSITIIITPMHHIYLHA